MATEIFPSRIASGKAFCNREDERKMLSENIKHLRHTLIISPRRYGKTSLALQTISENDLPHAYINLFNALRDESVAKKFTKGLSELLSQLISPQKKALKKLGELLNKAHFSVHYKDVKFAIGLEPISKEPLEIVTDLLEDIERVLLAENKRAVIVLDEFQDIAKTNMNDELQAALRDFAQRTQTVTLIISGSHRNMLNKIFDDRNKPFYKLCDRINLDRIKSHDYTAFIQKHAQFKWKAELPEQVINKILTITENHPYYVNRLCSKLWGLNKTPKIEDVPILWNALKEEEYDSVVNDISLLAKNQRIVLQAIAQRGYLAERRSISVTKELEMAQSSVAQAIDALLKNDFIEETDKGYKVIDPLVSHILREE